MRCCVAPDAEFSVEVIYGKAFVFVGISRLTRSRVSKCVI